VVGGVVVLQCLKLLCYGCRWAKPITLFDHYKSVDDKTVHLLVNLQHIDCDQDKPGGCVYRTQVRKVLAGWSEAQAFV
jgi:hypothetical protein